MEIIIEEFKPLVEKLAREHYINVTIGEEDVRQELWRKLFEIAHTLSYSNDKEKDEVFRWVKTLFNNLIKDIKYSESRTHGSSQYCLMGDLTQLLSDEMGSIFEKISDHNQEDYLVTKELYGLIMKFAETQSASMKRFIYERLDTSKEIEDKWEESI